MNKVMRKDTIVYRFIDDFYMAYEKFKKCHGHKVGAFADEIWLLVRNLHANMQEIEKQEDELCDNREPLEQRVSRLTDVMQNLLTFMVQEKMEKSKEHTATEEKKSPEPVPISVKPVEKLPESENDVVYWGM